MVKNQNDPLHAGPSKSDADLPPVNPESAAEASPVTSPESESASPTKVCRFCSVQSVTAGAFCPNCGKPFGEKKSALSTRAKILTAVVVAVVILGGASAGLVAVSAQSAAVEAAAKEDARLEAEAVAKQEKKEADAASAAKAADDLERSLRTVSVTEMEKSITDWATEKTTSGVLKGPIIRTSCTPLGGGSTDDLTAITTIFSCIAVNVENADGSATGYRVSATFNWDTNQYTWHLGD